MDKQQFMLWCISTEPRPSLIMGILNLTPDSFSDGGLYNGKEAALNYARRMIAAGADLLDIGGESTQPGSMPVSVDEELHRVMPVIEAITNESDICLSIDTSKAQVMQAAVKAGAGLVNDVTALKHVQSLKTLVDLHVPVCLMHMRSTPELMQTPSNLIYEKSIVDVVQDFFSQRIQSCIQAGLPRELLLLDPGFGFGKSVHQNLDLIAHFNHFQCNNLPLMIGISRKSTLGAIVNKPVNERLIAGITMSTIALMQGANILRTHDVKETKDVLLTIHAINARAIQSCA